LQDVKYEIKSFKDNENLNVLDERKQVAQF